MRTTALDLETEPIDRGDMAAPPPVCASVASQGAEPYVAHVQDVEWSFLNTDLIIGVNIAYDACVLVRREPWLRARVIRAFKEERTLDIALAQRLLDIAAGRIPGYYSLASLARMYLGIDLEKDAWRLWYKYLKGVPVRFWPVGAVLYAQLDAWATLAVWERMLETANMDVLAVLGHATKTDWALADMSVNGVPTDRRRAEALVTATETHLAKLTKRLVRAGLVRANGTRDDKAAMAYAERLCARRFKGKGWKLTDTGRLSLDVEAAEASGSYVLQARAQFVSATTLRGRAQAMLECTDLPYQPNYNSIVDTYRTSCSIPSEPLVGGNIQNVPKAMALREVFRP